MSRWIKVAKKGKYRILYLLITFSVASMIPMIIFTLRCSETNQVFSMERGCQEEIRTLQKKITDLETQLTTLKNHKQSTGSERCHGVGDAKKIKEAFSPRYLQDELDVIQYASFTEKWIYVVNSGMYGRVLERLTGIKKRDLQETIVFAAGELRGNQTAKGNQYNFVSGIYRTDPGLGTHYQLYFQNKNQTNHNTQSKVTLFRPFSSLHHISTVDSRGDLILMILPLSGRLDAFKTFMDRFIVLCVKRNESIHLTIVHYGSDVEDLRVQGIVDDITKTYNFSGINLLKMEGTFSRGQAIEAAVEDWSSGDVRMFFCDVDVLFRAEFLQKCRLNSQSGVKAYYPIVFSLYNPYAVYQLNDIRIPRFADQLSIKSDTGFWRDFGYGMTCQYRNDFLRMKGFPKDIVGWGTEDTMLFREYAQSNISTIRAVDHSIYHLWHDKECSIKLSWIQFKSCIMSRTRNEASHGLLGMLAFREEVEKYKINHGMLRQKEQKILRKSMLGNI